MNRNRFVAQINDCRDCASGHQAPSRVPFSCVEAGSIHSMRGNHAGAIVDACQADACCNGYAEASGLLKQWSIICEASGWYCTTLSPWPCHPQTCQVELLVWPNAAVKGQAGDHPQSLHSSIWDPSPSFRDATGIVQCLDNCYHCTSTNTPADSLFV